MVKISQRGLLRLTQFTAAAVRLLPKKIIPRSMEIGREFLGSNEKF